MRITLNQIHSHCIILNALLIWLLPLALKSQIHIQKRLTVEDGLVQSQVTCMTEDLQGNLWIGAFGGLSRWNGHEFKNYQTQNGLSSPDIRCILLRTDGALLVGTNGGGLMIYKEEKFTYIDSTNGLPDNTVRAIAYGSDGRLYVGTDAGLCVLTQNKSDTSGFPAVLRNSLITSLSTGKEGTLICGTYNNGLVIWPLSGKPDVIDRSRGLLNNRVRSVLEAGDGSLYVAMIGNGVARFQGEEITYFNTGNGLPHKNIRAIIEDRKGVIYFASLGGGLGIYKNGQISVIDESNGLTMNTVWNIYESRSGILYIATWDGISIFERDRFSIYNRHSGLARNVVTAFAEGVEGDFFIGSLGGGIQVVKKEDPASVVQLPGLPDKRVWSLLYAPDNSLYIGTASGLFHETKRGIHRLIDHGGSLSNTVYSITKSSSGKILVGGYNGLYAWNGESLEQLYSSPSSNESQIFAIHESLDGSILIGTRAGGIKISGGVQNPATNKKILPGYHIWSIYQKDNGPVFWGTNGRGLVITEKNSIREVAVKDGLSDNTVYGILEDNQEQIYLSTHRGINILVKNGDNYKVHYLRYGDGLASDECTQGAYFRDRGGGLWWGTIKGATRFNPAYTSQTTRPPQTHITRIRLYDKDINLRRFKEGAVFEYNENYLRFDYIGVHLPAPEKVIYRYRLTGVDRDWVESGKRFTQYTNLPDGEYRFQLKSSHMNGSWSTPLEVRFTVLPPFWKTWWFILLAILIIGGSVAGLIVYRVKQLLAIELLRTKIAADLHDDIGAGLTEISILGEIVSQTIPRESAASVPVMLDKVSSRARELIDSMSDIVWLISPQKESLFDLISRLNDVFETLFEANEIKFKPQNVETLKELKLAMETRQHLYLLLKEAIYNSIKYSHCRKIILQVEIKNRYFKICVIDDGRGFDVNVAHTGNGLRNMQQRALFINGTLAIESGIDRGTTITISGRFK